MKGVFGSVAVQNMVETIGSLPGFEVGTVDFVVLGMIGAYEVAVGRCLNAVGAGRAVKEAVVGKIGTIEDYAVLDATRYAAAEAGGVVVGGESEGAG